MRSTSKFLSTALVAAALAAPQAFGQTVASSLSNFASSLDDYNLVSINNSTFNAAGDTQGGIAVGGSLTVINTTYVATGGFGDVPSNGAPTLYVAGNLNLSGSTLGINAGYAALPGLTSSNWTWNANQKVLTEENGGTGQFTEANGSGDYAGTSPLVNPIPKNWNWQTLASSLRTDSTTLGNTAANGSISVNSGNLIFTPNTTPSNGSAVIFTLNAALISGNTYNGQTFSNISINVPTDVNYVINVVNAAGTTLFGSGANFNSGSNNNQLLWNFVGSSGTVTLGNGGSFYGSILSPSMNVNTGGVTVNGQVGASSFSDSNAELHFEGFDAVAVVVPEPLTFALWGVGLCGVAIVIRRKLVD
ncbi:MAG TPA: collagen-binding domain-containing protein [Opitutaceae bacterium]|jgi:choice-of-anchor A domain-containing protein